MANHEDDNRGNLNQGGRSSGNGNGNQASRSSGRSERGFAAMNPEQQREIARKGGEAVSQDREHMAAIGRKGGEASGGGNRNKNNDAGESGEQRNGNVDISSPASQSGRGSDETN